MANLNDLVHARELRDPPQDLLMIRCRFRLETTEVGVSVNPYHCDLFPFLASLNRRQRDGMIPTYQNGARIQVENFAHGKCGASDDIAQTVVRATRDIPMIHTPHGGFRQSTAGAANALRSKPSTWRHHVPKIRGHTHTCHLCRRGAPI